MNERSAFTARLLISMHTINQASKRAKKRRANYCNSRSKCAKSFLMKVKLPKRLRARSMPTRRTFFTCYGIWRATMHESRSQPAMKLRMVGFRLDNPSKYSYDTQFFGSSNGLIDRSVERHGSFCP